MEKLPQELCIKCGKCCKKINCKFLRYDNACMIYNDRPAECKSFPFNIWDEVPDGCGYEGWIFLQREKEKQQVRFKKEKILSLKVRMKYATISQKDLINSEIKELNDYIDKFSEYGSKDW